MKLYLVRHGETDYNIEKKILGNTDLSLNAEGIKQGYYLKELLKNENIDIIISSPFLRSKQTAEIINENFELEIQFDDRICERNYGEFEGISIIDFDFVSFWEYNSKRIGTSETTEKFVNRVFDFLNDLKETYNGKKILIVAHGSTNLAISAYFAKTMPTNLMDISSKIESMEVNEYEY